MKQEFINPFKLDDEIALITGGGTGIGFGIAKAFVNFGAKVIIVGRREEPLQKAVKELGHMADYRVYDVTKYEKSESLIDSINQQHGQISILVNNAGMHLKKAAIDVTEEEFLQVLNVNVLGAFSLSRQVAKKMLESSKGNILFIASLASLIGIPSVTAYSAAKSAYLGMVRSLATEWSPQGIRVNAIAPGFIDTAMMRKATESDPKRVEKILGRTPMGRFGEIEDIGWVAVSLVSPAGKFITGVCLPVDGGASIGF
jgi:NAD(P)-dependent dehydrogenase (short-subunit alcohol dehydrogenase family)